MSGTTGIAPGFGGFAATPDGQLTYMNRQWNPYGFLQQDRSGLAATAPAADQALAAGGLAGYRRVQRLEDGGDAGDGGDGDDSGGAAGGTNGPFGGSDAPGNGPGFGSGFATEVGGVSSPAAGINGMIGGMTTAGQPSGLGGDPIGMSLEQAPSFGQLGFAAAKGGLGGLAPGLNAIGSMTGLSAAAANALGVGQMGPGATAGSGFGASVGSALGGPAGGAIGGALGAAMGAAGVSGTGLGGTNSNAGAGLGVDSSARDLGQGSTDLTSLIQRIRAAMGDGTTQPQHLARGGTAGGPPGPMHFHGGSGLVHSASDGRADAVQTHVPQGSYVVPADVVSGLGQGNTMAGAKKLGGMLRPATHFATGGTVPVRLSGGEFVLHPAHVAALGGGNLKAGSDKLDEMVGHVRRISAAQVAGMPPPR